MAETDKLCMKRRVLELERDGYIEFDPPEDRRPGSRAWALTEKGWAALSAAAETSIKKPTKPSP